MKNTALGAAHMVYSLDPGGGTMVKVRMQGTKEDMKWLEEQINKLPDATIVVSSEAFHNKGTNRFFRRYLEIDKKENCRK